MNHLVKKYNLHCFTLLEPKDTTLPVDHYIAKFKCQGAFANSKNSIWFLWKDTINVSMESQSDQHITVRIVHRGRVFIVTSVYASCDASVRKELWSFCHYM